MAEIKAIGKGDVHQICSGQVVLDLATAVKELLENSLDALATSIEVKLKEYGSEQIEVCDNGIGVQEKNFEALTKKHWTSKLNEFSDLLHMETFGFRGEALSSLCALSDVVITTKHKDAKFGHRLEFNNNGNLVKKSQTARQTGTTVYLNNIFHTLPVRHKEYHRNIKKEYIKLLSLLHAYCLISTNIRISCWNQTKIKKSIIIGTQGSSDLKQNILVIFGMKQFKSLMEFNQVVISSEVCEEFGIESLAEESDKFNVTGWISNIIHGNGRSSPDRQFYFINSRPVDHSRLSKLVNEVYRTYNRHQYPFVLLNIKVKRQCVDVNVTPNKRQVFLENEKLLLGLIKSSLIKLFGQDGAHTIPSHTQDTLSKHQTLKQKPYPESMTSSLNQKLIVTSSIDQSQSVTSSLNQKRIVTSSIDQSHSVTSSIDQSQIGLLSRFQRKDSKVFVSPSNRKRPASTKTTSVISKQRKVSGFCSSHKNQVSESIVTIEDQDNNIDQCCSVVTKLPSDVTDAPSMMSSDLKLTENSNRKSIHEQSENFLTDTYTVDQPIKNHILSSQVVKFSMTSLMRRMIEVKRCQPNQKKGISPFQATIVPSQNNNAETELSRNLRRDDFKQMEIIGQFNLGFIVVRHLQDLFIVDQHASDEIYNFETLQQSTKVLTQKLFVPKKLELSASDKLILMENIDIFERNGFDFTITSKNGQDSISLVKVPMSKNWEFGPSDVDELIFMLSDAPGVMCRPSRVRNMFASRACRKSVMIGKFLSRREMKRLIEHMSEINHPWNCPHGRPTMRHIVDLSRILVDKED